MSKKPNRSRTKAGINAKGVRRPGPHSGVGARLELERQRQEDMRRALDELPSVIEGPIALTIDPTVRVARMQNVLGLYAEQRELEEQLEYYEHHQAALPPPEFVQVQFAQPDSEAPTEPSRGDEPLTTTTRTSRTDEIRNLILAHPNVEFSVSAIAEETGLTIGQVSGATSKGYFDAKDGWETIFRRSGPAGSFFYFHDPVMDPRATVRALRPRHASPSAPKLLTNGAEPGDVRPGYAAECLRPLADGKYLFIGEDDRLGIFQFLDL